MVKTFLGKRLDYDANLASEAGTVSQRFNHGPLTNQIGCPQGITTQWCGKNTPPGGVPKLCVPTGSLLLSKLLTHQEINMGQRVLNLFLGARWPTVIFASNLFPVLITRETIDASKKKRVDIYSVVV